MKTKSQELADSFKSGSTIPIIEAMQDEFEKIGLQENQIINKLKFASYQIGRFISQFDRFGDKTYAYIDNYWHKENDKKPIDYRKTLQKPAFVNAMQQLSEEDKHIYAEIVLLEETEVNAPMFWAGVFTENILQERRRIGFKLQQLRKEANLSLEQLAHRTGLEASNINRVELGKYSSGQDVINKIALALGYKLDIV